VVFELSYPLIVEPAKSTVFPLATLKLVDDKSIVAALKFNVFPVPEIVMLV